MAIGSFLKRAIQSAKKLLSKLPDVLEKIKPITQPLIGMLPGGHAINQGLDIGSNMLRNLNQGNIQQVGQQIQDIQQFGRRIN